MTSGKLTHWIGFIWLSCLITLPVASAASFAGQVEAIYQPLRVDHAALAPDGRHVAFAIRDHEGLHAVIYDVDNPDLVTRRLLADEADVHLQFLEWAGSDQLIAATDASQVVGINPLTKNSKILADAASFGAKGKDNTSILVRVAGVSEDSSSATLEVSRFTSSLQVELEAVRLDLFTGTRIVLDASRLDIPGGEIMTDRQGRPRVRYDRGASPQSFDFLPLPANATEQSDWKPLDRALTEKPARNFHVTPRSFLGERSFPLGFDYNPHLLYYASNIGRATFGIYSLDLSSGRSVPVAETDTRDLADLHRPLSGSMLVFDRAHRTLAGIRSAGPNSGTRWLDREIAGIQESLEKYFTARQIQMLGWDDSRTRFLLLVTSDRDPGRYFIYHRSDGHCVEYFRRTLLDADEANPTETFTVSTANGALITGTLTRPHATTNQAPGLVIWFHDGPWQHVDPGFQADAQALAAMGFAVAQINYRGSTGYGRQHALAIQEGFDRVPVADALATIDLLVRKHGIDPARIAVAGEGFGGFLALRAVQLHPETFRCAVALDAPLDLDWPGRLDRSEATQLRAAKLRTLVRDRPPLSFLGHGVTSTYDGRFERDFVDSFFQPASGQKLAVDTRPELFTRPLLLLHDPKNSASPIERVRKMAREIARRKQTTARVIELPPLFLRDLSITRVEVFQTIGDFLQTHLGAPVQDTTPGQKLK